MIFAPWLTLFPGRFNGKDETDADRLERSSESKDDQPKTLKEWLFESKAVAMLGINAWLLYFLRVSLNLILTKAKIIVKILLKRAKNSLLISSTFVDH